MTGIVGIEPTPTVLETVVLPLNYIPIIKKWKGVDSNRRHMELQSIALPTELPSQLYLRYNGPWRIWTDDLLRDRETR